MPKQRARATSICVARCMHVILHILLGAQTKDSSISADCHIYIYTECSAAAAAEHQYQTSNNHSLLISSFIFYCNIRFLADFFSFRFVSFKTANLVCRALSWCEPSSWCDSDMLYAIKLNAANFCNSFFRSRFVLLLTNTHSQQEVFNSEAYIYRKYWDTKWKCWRMHRCMHIVSSKNVAEINIYDSWLVHADSINIHVLYIVDTHAQKQRLQISKIE